MTTFKIIIIIMSIIVMIIIVITISICMSLILEELSDSCSLFATKLGRVISPEPIFYENLVLPPFPLKKEMLSHFVS